MRTLDEFITKLIRRTKRLARRYNQIIQLFWMKRALRLMVERDEYPNYRDRRLAAVAFTMSYFDIKLNRLLLDIRTRTNAGMLLLKTLKKLEEAHKNGYITTDEYSWSKRFFTAKIFRIIEFMPFYRLF
ncbi:MAG: hypothetical protein LBS16_03275 [Prevotellaceae bacterium]|nr:hypothetical protein [Prevotellaceae bacterium]